MADESPDTTPATDLAANALATRDGAGDIPSIVNTGDGRETLVTAAMTKEEVQEWWKRIERADERRDNRAEMWDILLDAYTPMVTKDAETIKLSSHFRNVHSKIGQMFYRSPEIRLDPKGPTKDRYPNPTFAMMVQQGLIQPGMPLPPNAPPQYLTQEDIISTKQTALNTKLGRDGLKSNRLMDELLFDVLGWSGIGVCTLGYSAAIKMVQEPVMQPAPQMPTAPGPGSILGLSGAPPSPPVPVMDPATGQPMMRNVPVPVHQTCYLQRLSPKQVIIDDALKS